jgi:hypothetical protein
MSSVVKLTLAGLVLTALAACATAPAVDLTPPAPRVDAKTSLEYGSPGPRR